MNERFLETVVRDLDFNVPTTGTSAFPESICSFRVETDFPSFVVAFFTEDLLDFTPLFDLTSVQSDGFFVSIDLASSTD